jgi:competence protein ComEC
VITSPAGRHILVDGGPVSRGGYDAGERIVVPALRALGISTLDTVVATHPDADHIGGLAAVLDAMPARQVFDNGRGRNDDEIPLYRNLMSAAARRSVPVLRTPSVCGAHAFDGAVVTVLHPCDWDNGFDPSASANDNSLVLLVRYKQVRILLLGDAGADVETMLAKRGLIPIVDVLKLSHHGSRTATGEAFLDAARPAVAIVSAGRHNRFGMPHRTVLLRLLARKILVLRTDLSGAIRVSTDGVVTEWSPTSVD